jgi:hypothetical protein
MLRKVSMFIGALIGTSILVLALWSWQNSDQLAARFSGRDSSVDAMAARCIAVAMLGLGECLIVMLVIGNVWRRDTLTNLLGLSALIVFMLSTAGAVALGLAGR